MTSYLIRRLQTLTPNTDYVKLLNDDFGVVAPTYSLKYQQEFLYKYLLKDKYAGMAFDIERAKQSVDDLVGKYPHILLKYENDTVVDRKPKSTRKTYKIDSPDVCIVFNPTRKKYVAIKNKKTLARSKTLQGVHALLEKKHGLTNVPFIEKV